MNETKNEIKLTVKSLSNSVRATMLVQSEAPPAECECCVPECICTAGHMSPGWQRARAEEESEALNHLKLGQS